MESRFKHYEEVVINFGKSGILSGQVHAITFTESKVFYDILISPFENNKDLQTLRNIDSYFVENVEDRFNGKSNIGIIDTKN